MAKEEYRVKGVSGEVGVVERVRYISHRDKQILFVDLSGCTSEEALKTAEEVQAIVTKQPKESVLLLADLTGAQIDKVALDRMKKAAAFDRPHVKRSAMIGQGAKHTALKQALEFFSQRDYRSFENKDQALDWLVS